MERNRFAYFFIGVIITALGYIVRYMQLDFYREGSMFLIMMGIYFLLAIMFHKAASWVLVLIDLFIGVGLQALRLFSVEWYNTFYDSQIGHLIIGGPYESKIFFYVALGVVFGAAAEIMLRQYNKVGYGD